MAIIELTQVFDKKQLKTTTSIGINTPTSLLHDDIILFLKWTCDLPLHEGNFICLHEGLHTSSHVSHYIITCFEDGSERSVEDKSSLSLLWD